MYTSEEQLEEHLAHYSIYSDFECVVDWLDEVISHEAIETYPKELLMKIQALKDGADAVKQDIERFDGVLLELSTKDEDAAPFGSENDVGRQTTSIAKNRRGLEFTSPADEVTVTEFYPVVQR